MQLNIKAAGLPPGALHAAEDVAHLAGGRAAGASHAIFPGSAAHPTPEQMASLRNMHPPMPAGAAPARAPAMPQAMPQAMPAARPPTSPGNQTMFPGSANLPTPEQMAALRGMSMRTAAESPSMSHAYGLGKYAALNDIGLSTKAAFIGSALGGDAQGGGGLMGAAPVQPALDAANSVLGQARAGQRPVSNIMQQMPGMPTGALQRAGGRI